MKCWWFLFHNWAPWNLPTYDPIWDSGLMHTATFITQRRHCKKCYREQVRKRIEYR